MTHLQRRLKKLEGVFTDPLGFVPHTQKWLEYWDQQYSLFLGGDDSIWLGDVAVFRAVMKYAEESPASLARRVLDEDQAVEDHWQAVSAA